MQSKIIYPNVRIAMARLNWTIDRLSKETGIPLSTLHDRLTGKRDLTFGQAYAIKRALGVEMSLDELFEMEEV